MSLEEILVILDKNRQRDKQSGLLLIVCGALIVTAAVFAGIYGDWSGFFLLAFPGSILFCGGLYKKFSKLIEKQTDYAKNALSDSPKELVWVYVHRIGPYGSGAFSRIILNFRNGMSLGVDRKYLPGNSTAAFMDAVLSLNLDAHAGYSEELKQLHTNKRLS